ncbi:MAG TPA: hypothetical protein VGH28_14360 [Polyangiaceae bacterium]|jgi:hypothetical protein
MGTIQAKNNPSSRITAGDRVIQGAKSVNTTVIKAKLARFAKAHTAYSAAQRAVEVAEQRLVAAEERVGETDGAQDALVKLLAAKMIGDGAPKGNPLSLFKLPPPSELVIVRVEVEVKKTKQLAKQAASWKSASSATKSVAAKLGKAAAAVESALKKIAPLAKAHTAAIAKRDALGVDWVTSFTHLKNAARVAEDDGTRGLFAALFEAPTARPATKAKPTSADGAATAPAAPLAPAT